MKAGCRHAILLLSALVCASPAIAEGNAVTAKLSSPNAQEEVTGVLTLNGFDLSGHLSGERIDVTVSGTVKGSVSIIVTGRILPTCSLNRQTMSGTASNDGQDTSVAMLLHCQKSGGWGGGGADYLFRLDLGLPASPLQIPSGGDAGESAAISPISGEIQRDLT
jgi:hypothetical protein